MTAVLKSVNRGGVAVETIPVADAVSCAGECEDADIVNGVLVPCTHRGSVVYSAIEVGGSRLELTPPARCCPTHAARRWRDGYELFGVVGYETPEEAPAGAA